MPVAAPHRHRVPDPLRAPDSVVSALPEPRTVRLTLGPAADAVPLLRAAAELLDAAGVVPSAITQSRDAHGVWLQVTCEVDPADVAALVATPALAAHSVDAGPRASGRCPACDLRDYLGED